MFFETKNLSVGYDGKSLIHDINVQIHKGQITTLIGPNGSGKSTILKTITRHLEKIAGTVYIGSKELTALSSKELAKQLSVVLTDRISTEYMTCEDIVGLGRYPYTNNFGLLNDEDKKIVSDSLEKVHAEELKDRDFNTLSDGQKQRVLLARAICQKPEIIVLDEPTSFLDIHYKIELLDILSKMAKDENIAVIMSLHEIDFAPKISDMIICVNGDTISHYGTPQEIFKEHIIEELYGLETGRYNMLFGSVELPKSGNNPEVFVIAGNGFGIPYYRELQKKGLAFRTGILFENDVDYQVAVQLSSEVFAQEPFTPISDLLYDKAYKGLKQSRYVIDTGSPIGEFNKLNKKLLDEAIKLNIPIFKDIYEFLSIAC